MKMLFANGLSRFFINGEPVFSNGPINLLRNTPDCTTLNSWISDSSIFGDKLLAKAFRILETCISVNNIICGKLVLSLESPITFDESFRVTSVSIFYFWF